MTAEISTHTPTEILLFWFGSEDLQAEASGTTQKYWFQRNDEFDRDIRNRFASAIDAAIAGHLNHWQDSLQGRLALILLCDQFPRNIHRGSHKAFAGDPLALEVCQSIVREGRQRELGLQQRAFAGIPFEHSESADIQQQSVDYFDQLRQDYGSDTTPAEARSAAESYYRFAVAHKQVIDRFGRYPHRNAALSRDNTPAEQTWLDNGGGF